MDLKEIWCKDADLIQIEHGRVQLHDFVNTGYIKGEEFLGQQLTISFSIKTLLLVRQA
jgi:hypothetical protein